LEELIKFCEQRNLVDVATGLKKDLKQLVAPAAKGSNPDLQNKEN
jgi:hypothetical protein